MVVSSFISSQNVPKMMTDALFMFHRTLFVVPEDAQASVVQLAKKMTLRKKQLASKVKKTKGGKGN